MANRVLMNASGFKVSKPGVDVLAAGNINLSFSSDWSAMGVIQSGSYNVSGWSGSTGSHYGSIALVKSFASPPFCAFFLDSGSYMAPLGYGNGFTLMIDRNDGDITNPDSRSCLVAQVGTSSISISAMYFKTPLGSPPGGTAPTPTYAIKYFVFDRNQ